MSPSDSRCASLCQVDLQDQHRDQQEGRETRAVRLEVRVGKKARLSETWPSGVFTDVVKRDDRKREWRVVMVTLLSVRSRAAPRYQEPGLNWAALHADLQILNN